LLISKQHRQHPWRRVPSRRQPSECKAPRYPARGLLICQAKFAASHCPFSRLRREIQQWDHPAYQTTGTCGTPARQGYEFPTGIFTTIIDKQLRNGYHRINYRQHPWRRDPSRRHSLSARPQVTQLGAFSFPAALHPRMRCSRRGWRRRKNHLPA